MQSFFKQYFSLSNPAKGCIYLENMAFLSDRLDAVLSCWVFVFFFFGREAKGTGANTAEA